MADIFTPRKPAAASAGYAVMVWIHGGSYSTGTAPNATGIVDWSGDVVWVGVNYRMNV
jgi:carboxylesterase type B